jgi:hypothetical protein
MFDLPPPDPAIEISIASRGISKGLAQTDGPQLLARGEVGFGRLYAGAYAKNVTSPTSDGEAGAVIGLRAKAGGFDLAASAALKIAIAPAAGLDKEALELAGSISRKMGRVTPRVSVIWSPGDLGSTGRSVYAEAGLAYDLGGGTSLGGAVARRERAGGADYTAFNAGIVHVIAGRFTVDLRWYDTGSSALGDPYRGRLVAALRAKF